MIEPGPVPLWLGASAALVACVLSVIGTRMVLIYLDRRQILDQPNERSSHCTAVPRGGGLAAVPAAVVPWTFAVAASVASPERSLLAVIAAGAIALMVLSWLDDRKSLPVGPRLAAHAAAVAVTLAMLPAGTLIFHGALPLVADRVLAGLGWLWFVNLYNFMDGVDGITGTESASLGLGVALCAALVSSAATLVAPALAVTGAALGFLVWNWHPARVFLGDVGSIPLGYLLGGLLVMLAASGEGGLAAAMILPGYYLADATITLIRRALNGKAVWRAHREHFYQRAVRGGRSHSQVVRAIIACNVVLVAAAGCAAAGWIGPGLMVGTAATAMLLMVLGRWGRGAPP